MSNLSENLNDVISAIDDIKTAIESRGGVIGECTSISEYADAINNLPDNVYSGTFLAFRQSDTTPDVPQGGSWNGSEFKYPEGWESSAGMRSRARTASNPKTWMSFAIMTKDDNSVSTWSQPIKISGEDGLSPILGTALVDGILYWTLNGNFLYDANGNKIKAQGLDGKDGKDGKNGKNGEDGKDGINGVNGNKFEFIYKLVADESVVVSKPSKSQADNYVPTSEGWTKTPSGISSISRVEYFCQREKISDIWSDWSNPTIWSQWGKMGRDGNGVEYIYKLSANETDIPDTPIAPSNVDPESYPSDWSDDPLSVTPETPICWVSSRKQHYTDDSQFWTEYTTPSVWAKYGIDGKNGGRTIFVFTSSSTINPDPAILPPIGGTWNPETNELTDLESSQSEYIWNIKPNTTNGKFIWQSVGEFTIDGQVGNWSDPFCITGDDGKNGSDGTSIEFIYRLIPNKNKFEELKAWLNDPDHKLENTSTNIVPNTLDSISDKKWTDNPSGISDQYLLEVVCSRKALHNENNEHIGWTEWSTPTIWAMWGEDGNDGPGVEYIFLITSDEFKNGVDLINNGLMPIPSEMAKHSRYQESGFVPNKDFEYFGYDWSDEPKDVGPNEPREWVSIRKGEVSEDGSVSWGLFSIPKLWGKYASDGYTYKTSYVFSRGDEPSQPEGGDFDNPYPMINGERNSKWEDSIPEGSGTVWMSLRTFRSDDFIVDDSWTKPKRMTETSNLQIEYTQTDISVIEGYYPDNFGNYSSEQAWRDNELTKGVDWSNEGINALYMAITTMHDDTWSEWTVTKIKGETGEKGDKGDKGDQGDKGDKGEDGSSVYIEGKFDKLSTLKNEWELYTKNPSEYVGGNDNTFIIPLDPGDGYLVDEEGLLYVYSGAWQFGQNNEFENYWTGVALKGEKGDSAYIYIRYSNDMVSFTEDNGLMPGKYIAVLTGKGELDPDTLNNINTFAGLWQEWKGQDGLGFEQIFLLTTDKYNPEVLLPAPSDSKNETEYRPDHGLHEDAPGTTWCDGPQIPTKEYPYCWVVVRRYTGNEFGPWRGCEIDGVTYASIYSRYTYDGISSYHLELSKDQLIIPLENDAIDPDFTDELTTKMSLLYGDSAVTSGVSYSINNADVATCSNLGVVSLQKSKINEIDSIECIAEYNGQTYKKTFYIHKTYNAYKLIPNKNVLIRDASNGYLVDNDKIVKVEVKKWNGKSWSVPDNKNVFAKITHLYGEDAFIEADSVNWADGFAEFDFGDEQFITKIKFYLTSDDTPDIDNDTSEFAFEEIGVVTNGEDGVGNEYIYYRCNADYTGGWLGQTPNDFKNNTYNGKTYQDNDWVPITEGWTDNPSGVNSKNKYEYVSERKKTNKVWGEFSTPVLWAKFGEQGPQGPQGDKGDDGASGEPGAKGSNGPLIYPAGEWNSETVYYAYSTRAPYVYYNDSYYVLNIEYLVIEEGEGSEWSGTNCAPGTIYEGEPVWIKMDTFEAIYADIGVFKEALVGPAVFYGDYMFSQKGYTQLTNGTETESYELFNPEDPFGDNNSFYPNVCFNFKTGDIWIQRQSLVVKNNSIKLGGWNVDFNSIYTYDGDRDIQMILSTGLGFRIGTMTNLIKYIGLCPDGTAYFSNARFNNDGSGYLGGSNSDSSIIAWDSSSVRIGFGDNAIIYNKNSSGTISRERNSINTRHYQDMTSGKSTTIIDLIGYEHNFLFRDDGSNFTIDFKINITNNSEIPRSGYCGTFVLSNATSYEKSVTINGWHRTTKTPLNTIKIAAKTCQVWKLYVIGLSVWYLLKVS